MKVSTNSLPGKVTAASSRLSTTINNSSAQQNRKPALFMRWRLALLLMISLLVGLSVFSQPYIRSTFATSYTPITVVGGATQVITGTGVAQFSTTGGTSDGDEGAALIPLPFAFTYNGITYNAATNFVNICTNGFITFNTTGTNGSKTILTSSDGLFTTATPNIAIAGWWDDLNVSFGSGQVLYQTIGSQFIIQFTNLRTWWQTSTSTINFQIILNQTTNVVELKYGTATNAVHSTSEGASAGIEWGAGGPGNYIDAFTGSKTIGGSFFNSENFPSSTLGYRFTPGTPTAIGAGTINVGSGQTYPTLSEAIADVNHRGVSGAVTLNCTDVSYPISAGNIYPMILAPIAGVSGSNTVTINGNNAVLSSRGVYSGTLNSGASTISGPFSPVYLIGSDFITFRNFSINLSAAAPVTTAFAVATTRGLLVLNASATDGATNNTIRDVSVTLDRTNTSTIGIQQNVAFSPSSAAGANSTNFYYNLTISNVYLGIYLLGNATTPDLNCEIGGISGGTTTVGAATANDIGNGSSATWGIRASNQSGSAGVFRIFNTEVRNVTVTSTVLSDGIFLEGFIGNHEIFRNSVHDIRNSSTSATSGISGIRVTHNTTGTNNVKIWNNFVYGLTSGYTGSASATRQIKGIFSAGTGGGITQSVYVDFNSVRIDGSASPTISSTCWETATSAAASPVFLVRNNIFANVTGAQTGIAKHYSVFSTSATNTGGTGSVWNRNVYYTPNANGFAALGNATDYAAITGAGSWNAATGQDANSFNQNPQFNSATDLKINPSLATPVESNGSYFSGAITWVPQDKESDIRNATTPDIGADEGTFTPLISNDLQATAFVVPLNGAIIPAGTVTPQASYTNNGLNPQTGVTVRYRILNPAEVYNQTATIASIASGATVTVTFPTSGILSTPGGYTIISKAELAGDAVGANDEITGSITVIAPLAGDYNIGTAETAPFNNLATAITRLNTVGVSAPVRFLLTDATYNLGTTALQINTIAGSNGTNTFTLKPAVGTTPTITNNVATAAIIINAADNVIIDGSNVNIPAVNTVCPLSTATRNLTITNTNPGTASAVVWLQTAVADGATSNTVKNCNLVGNSNTTTLFGVGSGSSTIGTTSLGTGNNSNTFVNNNISKTQIGIYSQGAAIGNKNTGTVINQNLVNTASPNNVQIGGILVGFESGIIISGNNIANINSSGSSVYGIALGFVPNNDYAVLTGNEVAGAEVSKNVIDNILRTTDRSAVGISLAQCTSVAPATNSITNNMISGVRTTGATPSDSPFGIEVGGGTGATNVYFNTILMSGVGSSSSNGFGIAVGGSNPVVDIRNNIIVNKMTSTSGKMYALAFAYNTFSNLTSNNNAFFVTADATHFHIGTGGFTTPTGLTRAAWNSANPTKDGASISNHDPQFISAVTPANLHLQTGANGPLNATAASGTGILDDIDCDTRDVSTPDIGADEFTPPVIFDLAVSALTAPLNISCFSASENFTVQVTNTGNQAWDFSTLPRTVTGTVTNGSPASFGPVALTNAMNAGNPLAGGASMTVTLGAVTNMQTPQVYTFNATLNAAGESGPGSGAANDALTPAVTRTSTNPVATLNSNTPICSGSTLHLTANASGGNVSATPLTFNSGNINLVITDNTPAGVNTANLVVSGAGSVASASDLSVTLNFSPNHTWAGDIIVTLTSPGGTSIVFDRPGVPVSSTGNSDNLAGPYTFTTSAVGVLPQTSGVGSTGGVINSGSYKPSTTADAAHNWTGLGFPFNANGNWTLNISDNGLNDFGTLQNWSVTVPAAPAIYTYNFGGPGSFGAITYSGANNSQADVDVTNPVAGNYSVAVTDAVSCVSASVQTSIAINPTPTVNDPADQVVCAGDLVTVNFTGSEGGATYTWTNDNVAIGLGAGPTAGNISFNATNAGNTPIVASITVTPSFNGCTGTPQTFTITVNPTPTVVDPADQVVCAGDLVTVNFTGSVGGATYTWSNDNVAIGLGAGPTAGNISFTATNAGNTPLVATVTVTPSANGCPGSPQTFTITVNPTPTVDDPADQVVCAGDLVTVNFTGSVGGATYTWTNDNVAIGLGAGPTAGNISFTATNAGSTPLVATVTVTPSANGCPGAPQTFTITVNPNANAGSVSGTSPVCVNASAQYNVTGNNAPGTWSSTNPAVATVSPTGLVTGVSGGTSDIRYNISSGCGAPVFSFQTVTVIGTLATPGPLTGFKNVCPYVGNNTQLTYSVPAVAGATYAWIIPPFTTLISGQGTNSIVITIQNGFIASANKQLRVTAQSPCGNSPQAVFFLLTQLPTTPQPIVPSSTNLCPVIGTATPISYTIPSVLGASSYIWTVTPSANITVVHPEPLPQNDTVINITYNVGFNTTNTVITVKASNDCGTSTARSYTVVKNNPTQPGLINGPNNACAYMLPLGAQAGYSITAVAGATNYTWTVPAGAVINSGQGTNSILMNYPSNFTTGSVTVTYTNGCGTSPVRTFSVAKQNAATPGVMDVIQLTPCQNRSYSYTVTQPANAVSVQWTIPGAGTLVSGQGTNSITVSYPSTAVNGNVTAQSINNCSQSALRTLVVKLPACPPEDPRPAFSKGGSPAAEGMSVNVFPNPSVSDFKMQVITAGKDVVNVRVLDLQGRAIRTLVVMPYETVSIGNELKAGTYMLEVRQGKEVKTTRLIKF